MARRAVTLRRIQLTDWRAVHSWASLAQACRFQAWGPNTEEQTHAFVADAVEAWSHSPQQRSAYAARVEGDVVGMGELHVRSQGQRQGEKGWRLLRKLRCSTNRITDILKAVVVLHHAST
ncbi:GNAT family N-acetyltransferase [Streptomyces sp. NPDC060022]|uniref:GNAT family N-acetyltransferase n=1 Tax=Streptomyces sp. NPDC060022 TaxID=3347039 RepID=UPI0036B3B320